MARDAAGSGPTLRSRFPSRTDSLYVFAACVIPVFLWAFLNYLDAFPGFALRLTLWDLVGTASYVLAFALIESLLLLLPWIVIAAILPARIFKDHFVAFASIIVLISSVWMMYANYYLLNFGRMPREQLLSGFILYLITVAVPISLVVRFRRVEKLVQEIIQRLAVLAYVYAGLGFIALIIVIIRNLG